MGYVTSFLINLSSAISLLKVRTTNGSLFYKFSCEIYDEIDHLTIFFTTLSAIGHNRENG